MGELTVDASQVKNRIVEVRRVRLGDIAHNPGNWRGHSRAQREAFDALVREVGWAGVPLVYNSTRTGALTYVDGHMRKEELPDLEADVALTDLTDEEADELLLSFDPISAMAEAEKDKLDALLRQVKSAEPALQRLAADLAERAGLEYGAAEKGEDPGADVDRAGELLEKWGVETGQLWQLGEHRLICGDCTDPAVVARVMGGEKADTVITDPPYGIDFDTDYTKLHGGNFGTQKRNNHPRVYGDDKEFDPTPLLDFKNVVLWGANCYPQHLKPGAFLVWDKRNGAGQTLFSDAEVGWLNRGHGCYIFSHKWDGLNRESERGEHYHPTQKPAALWEWVITEHVKDAEIVYEPYCGVGGVIIACERLGRRCRAIEISPAYCAVTLERLSLMGLTPVLLA